MSARIASSCSAWMVATMSRMRPVRSWSSAASSAPSPTTVKPDASAASASNTSSSMPEETPTVGLEVAAAGDAHRLDRGGPVEGLGDRGAPVDDQRREVVVGDRDAADVEGLASAGRRRPVGLGRRRRQEVEAAEAQRRVADVEAGQAAAGVGLGRLALEAGLVGAAPGDLRVPLGDPLGRPAHDVEAGVGGVEVALLRCQLGIGDPAPAAGGAVRVEVGPSACAAGPVATGSVNRRCSGFRELVSLRASERTVWYVATNRSTREAIGTGRSESAAGA